MSLHPVTLSSERFGRLSTLVLLGVVAIGPSLLLPEGHLLNSVGFLLAVILGATGDLEEEDEPEIAHIRDLYAQGDISLDEFERRAELVLDDEANRIREAVEEVGGIGPETSANVALAFRSEQELQRATVEDLQEVGEVGEQRAEDIASKLGGRST
ncbi:helix-hairpin-helix domain-containing protein [Haloarcula sp. CGMCC 1.2071]|uniref:helix-hairpin-helix domain-containing protein n=1 Tax=Haloarcula sp. CGMCC 1.2071 TaxID=3111454 RepID=UPI00300EB09E